MHSAQSWMRKNSKYRDCAEQLGYIERLPLLFVIALLASALDFIHAFIQNSYTFGFFTLYAWTRKEQLIFYKVNSITAFSLEFLH